MRLPYAEVKKVMDKQFSAGSPLSSKQEAGKCEVGGGAVGGGCCFQNVNSTSICGGCKRNTCST